MKRVQAIEKRSTPHRSREPADRQQPRRAGHTSLRNWPQDWLFSDTPKGAHASALIYSLIETAKANGQEPYAWLRHVLERLPQATTVEALEALLPWNCRSHISY